MNTGFNGATKAILIGAGVVVVVVVAWIYVFNKPNNTGTGAGPILNGRNMTQRELCLKQATKEQCDKNFGEDKK